MKIAIIALINNPVAKPFEGGMETQIWWLARKLIDRGHDVTLFASGDSDPDLNLVPIIPQSLFKNSCFKAADGRTLKNKVDRKIRSFVAHSAYKKLGKHLSKEGGFDIIHNNSLFSTPLLDAHNYAAPVVSTLHTPPFREITKGVIEAGKKNTVQFVSVSQSLADTWSEFVTSEVIYNGLNVENWEFQAEPDPEQAIWFGRITPQKGTHLAVQAAIDAGYKLNVFGRIVDQTYYDEKVAPLIESSKSISYGGNLDHKELQRYIGQSSVMINTPVWDEPFGLTFVEAMACGTPVVTLESGAAKEIITDETGVIVPRDDFAGLVEAIKISASFDRKKCRQHVEENFSLDKMTDAYLDLYESLT